MSRLQLTFVALIAVQAAHSIEEYVGRLYETFPPARFISTAISDDARRGFIIFNVALVSFGAWCCLWPVRRSWRGARALIWLWIAIELLNGIGHPIWTWLQRRYTPGVATAPLLLLLALLLLKRSLDRHAALAPPPAASTNASLEKSRKG
jgi:hypothetical protein